MNPTLFEFNNNEENFSQRPATQAQWKMLVNTESLLKKLEKRSTHKPATSTLAKTAPAKQSPIPLDILASSLSSSLKQKIQSQSDLSSHLQTHLNAVQPANELNAILELFIKDISSARDRLLTLNPGRRKMIEHRLEWIGRKIARSRGEKLNRSLDLPEILRETYREGPQTKLGQLAWKGFVAEVALYNILELFFLKSLDVYGWRPFSSDDLSRLNYSAHSFLCQRAADFAHDKHSWNFVRTNVYSWYVPSRPAIQEAAALLEKIAIAWSDIDLMQWYSALPQTFKTPYFDFDADCKISEFVLDLIENQLHYPLLSSFQDQVLCKKVFIPSLESGGAALGYLDRILKSIRKPNINALFHRAIWACESESLEAYWTEVLSLLKLIRATKSSDDHSPQLQNGMMCLHQLPHVMNIVQTLGLELHNLDQLPLNGSDVFKAQQGSAAQIQHYDTFDLSVVTDHMDRVKSARWMKALADQLGHWRNFISNSTNLNWGELHLWLGLSKVKDSGYCVYLSHRVLPEGGDGERFRKAILNVATLELFIELSGEENSEMPYRYLYVFKKNSVKTERDQHRPKFGKYCLNSKNFNMSLLEDANSTQAEISERGWDHLFVRGAAPLVRHLNHKFPKLFQIATVHTSPAINESSRSLFSGSSLKILEAIPETSNGQPVTYRFRLFQNPSGLKTSPTDALYIFPHNPIDLDWIERELNSPPVQFWIRHHLVHHGKSAKAELRSCPIVDLSHAPTEYVHEALDLLGTRKPSAAELKHWALAGESTLPEKQARFVALSKRFAELERVVGRYKPLFTGNAFEELNSDAVSQFYPAALLGPIHQSPEIRIQLNDRTRTSISPDHWVLTDVQSVTQDFQNKPVAYTVAYSRQGTSIQIQSPLALKGYLYGQLMKLKNYTWGEILSLLKVPKDVNLYSAQCNEILRVVNETAQEMRSYQSVLDALSEDLFELNPEVRQYLPH